MTSPVRVPCSFTPVPTSVWPCVPIQFGQIVLHCLCLDQPRNPSVSLRKRGGMNRTTDGWGSGLLGVIIFSGSLPATRVAIGDFSPLFLTSARAVIAAALAADLLMALRQMPPQRSDVGSLVVVGLGVVVGFPLLTALDFSESCAEASPKQVFWLFSGLG